MTTILAGGVAPSETRLNLNPIPVNIFVPQLKQGELRPRIRKGGLSDYLEERTYYFPNYDESNPAHAGLGPFVTHSDIPGLPKISVFELCETLNDDISKVTNYGDLLHIVHPKYIETRNFMDAVDEAIKTLSIYHGNHSVDRILDRLDTVYFMDLKWLRNYGKLRNLKTVHATVFDFDENVVNCTDKHAPDAVEFSEFRWNTAEGYAVLTMELDTGVGIHYFIAPDYFSGETRLKLVRARKLAGTSKFELYVDARGFLHVLEARDLFGSFMHLDISYASTRYYVDHGRAPMASLGSRGEDSANGIDVGHRFALAYIDRTIHPNRQAYIDYVKGVANGTAKTVEGEALEINTGADALPSPNLDIEHAQDKDIHSAATAEASKGEPSVGEDI